MKITGGEIFKKLSLDEDPLLKIIGGLLKPVLAIGGSVAGGPAGAAAATILSEAVGLVEKAIVTKGNERVNELLVDLNSGLLEKGLTPEIIVSKFENISVKDRQSLFNILERAYQSTKSERIKGKRDIIRRFVEETLEKVDTINLEQRDFFGTILLSLDLVDFQVLSLLKNGPEKVHPIDITIPGVQPFYIVSSILKLEGFALIRTVKRGMGIGGDLVNPSSDWWLGINEDGKIFFEYCLSSSSDIIG